jgi:glycosyltransferase involved in cell wall biosynthesis
MKPPAPGQVLMLTSFPPRVCGIATYSQDLITAISAKFPASIAIQVCALEDGPVSETYPELVTHTLDTSDPLACAALGLAVDRDPEIRAVMVQHEFGLFGGNLGGHLLHFLDACHKPVAVTFHTVLPRPDGARLRMVRAIAHHASHLIVLTKRSARILVEEYGIADHMIVVVPHGTHPVAMQDKEALKERYGMQGRTVLSTFGLLSPNKGIGIALEALPAIIARFPDVLYMVMGRTHPGVVRHEGERYRESLERRVAELGIADHVRFVNRYLERDELLERLRMTDIYLFTSQDREQAVSGTFAYAMASACPMISTRIPHATETLDDGAGSLIDFDSPEQLTHAAILLLHDPALRERMGRNALQRSRSSAWENVAIPHARIFVRQFGVARLRFAWPEFSLQHVERLTGTEGVVQFCDRTTPDLSSGRTLDDNARGMIALCMHHDLARDAASRRMIAVQLNFIEHCQQADGSFLNYVDEHGEHCEKNNHENLEDSNGRALWALGMLVASEGTLPVGLVQRAERMLVKALSRAEELRSPRAMAFAIKGLYNYGRVREAPEVTELLDRLAGRLFDRYKASSNPAWHWFETSMTYGNAVLPEALLLASVATGNMEYRNAAGSGMRFLLAQIFRDGHLRVISNRGWMQQGVVPHAFGEQPIDVTYTILALEQFWKVTGSAIFLQRMDVAFEWFLGNNHLAQVMYDTTTGGCHDGLEEHEVNLNQGAESTVCYLMARTTMERCRRALEAMRETAERPRLLGMGRRRNLMSGRTRLLQQ